MKMVAITDSQWDALQMASRIIVECGAEADNTPEHLLREFVIGEKTAEELAEMFLDSVEDFPGLEKARARFRAA